jgi:hypothetical protein
MRTPRAAVNAVLFLYTSFSGAIVSTYQLPAYHEPEIRLSVFFQEKHIIARSPTVKPAVSHFFTPQDLPPVKQHINGGGK